MGRETGRGWNGQEGGRRGKEGRTGRYPGILHLDLWQKPGWECSHPSRGGMGKEATGEWAGRRGCQGMEEVEKEREEGRVAESAGMG